MNEWISVKDRLPEKPDYDWVLVQCKMLPENYYGIPHIAEIRNGVWFTNVVDLPMEKCLSVLVTHWQPLPELPKD